MRDIFTKTLIDNAEVNEKVILLMAEVGYGVVEPFQKKFPNRFYNTGISEQSLVLTAAGMAMKGYKPIAYSMSSFLPTRAYEMIKDSICYQNLPVTLVGIGSGISYGKLGSTHHASEESALMRSLPNMTVIFPVDGDDCRESIDWAINHNGPVYIGLEKIKANITRERIEYSMDWKKYSDGRDAAILACGVMKDVALKVARELKNNNIDVSVYGLSTVKPLDSNALIEACECKKIFIIDEHSKMCGIGAEISEFIFEKNLQSTIETFSNISIPDCFPEEVWDENKLRDQYGMSVDKIVETVKGKMGI